MNTNKAARKEKDPTVIETLFIAKDLIFRLYGEECGYFLVMERHIKPKMTQDINKSVNARIRRHLSAKGYSKREIKQALKWHRDAEQEARKKETK